MRLSGIASLTGTKPAKRFSEMGRLREIWPTNRSPVRRRQPAAHPAASSVRSGLRACAHGGDTPTSAAMGARSMARTFGDRLRTPTSDARRSPLPRQGPDQCVTVTNYPVPPQSPGREVSSNCVASAWGPRCDACRSTRDGRNPSTADAPACPCYSGGTASAYRSCGCFDNRHIWRGDRSADTATMHAGHGRPSDQSVARAVVRSGNTPARTNSS